MAAAFGGAYAQQIKVCAWCRNQMDHRDDFGLARAPLAVSHGICPPCLIAQVITLPPISTSAEPLPQPSLSPHQFG